MGEMKLLFEHAHDPAYATLAGYRSKGGYQALGVMEQHLRTHDFFAADHYTIADIALYAYTHIAHECDYDLSTFPAIRAWLRRIAEQPGHVTMDWRREPATVE